MSSCCACTQNTFLVSRKNSTWSVEPVPTRVGQLTWLLTYCWYRRELWTLKRIFDKNWDMVNVCCVSVTPCPKFGLNRPIAYLELKTNHELAYRILMPADRARPLPWLSRLSALMTDSPGPTGPLYTGSQLFPPQVMHGRTHFSGRLQCRNMLKAPG